MYSTYYSEPSKVPATSEVHADLTDESSLGEAFAASRPHTVVLCAALTGVDYCEDYPDEAHDVNVKGPSSVAQLCREHGARLIHTSTDYVFDGEGGPYPEEAEAKPVNVYGSTKMAGEVEVLRTLPGAIIVRLCAVYGWNRLREKANSITWMLQKLRKGEGVPLFTDQRVSPSYAYDAASVILDLSEMGAEGIYHATPHDCVTRLELGLMVCEVFGMPTDLLRPSSLADIGLRARRPLHSCLLPQRLEKVLNRPIRPLRDALCHMRDTE